MYAQLVFLYIASKIDKKVWLRLSHFHDFSRKSLRAHTFDIIMMVWRKTTTFHCTFTEIHI